MVKGRGEGELGEGWRMEGEERRKKVVALS
jgi:hypothetical protein